MSVSRNAPGDNEFIIELTELVEQGKLDAETSVRSVPEGDCVGAAPSSPSVPTASAAVDPALTRGTAGTVFCPDPKEGVTEQCPSVLSASTALLSGIQSRLAALELYGVDKEALAMRVRELEQQMHSATDSIGQRLTALETAVTQVSPVATEMPASPSLWEKRLTALENQIVMLETLDRRLGTLEKNFSALDSRIEAAAADVAARIIREEITALLSASEESHAKL